MNREATDVASILHCGDRAVLDCDVVLAGSVERESEEGPLDREPAKIFVESQQSALKMRPVLQRDWLVLERGSDVGVHLLLRISKRLRTVSLRCGFKIDADGRGESNCLGFWRKIRRQQHLDQRRCGSRGEHELGELEEIPSQ